MTDSVFFRIGATESFVGRGEVVSAVSTEPRPRPELSTAPGSLARHSMQGFDAVRAALNPFSLAQRRKVPAGHGRGRHIVFAVDSSSFRFVDRRAVFARRRFHELTPASSSRAQRARRSVRARPSRARQRLGVLRVRVQESRPAPPRRRPVRGRRPRLRRARRAGPRSGGDEGQGEVRVRVRSIRGGRQDRGRGVVVRGDPELRRERRRRLRRGRSRAVRSVDARRRVGRRKPRRRGDPARVSARADRPRLGVRAPGQTRGGARAGG